MPLFICLTLHLLAPARPFLSAASGYLGSCLWELWGVGGTLVYKGPSSWRAIFPWIRDDSLWPAKDYAEGGLTKGLLPLR